MASKAVAACAGAVAFQALAALLSSPSARAAWGWQMQAPAGAGFSCQEGSTIGCVSLTGCTASNFTCTVDADDGKTCDATTTNIVCSIPGGEQNFVPVQGTCINMYEVAVSLNITPNNSTLSWSVVPNCTTPTATSAAASFVVGPAAAVALATQVL
eukprot:CAMPEP_0181456722 /NCGR_PEP_ID=MMETSP1110-20121109/31418_1 /TAXON_ID=174948 /ORGANISM="Symbiodinium sp., Strain CCMP421" /LENGTH=155 /DNA_ID=CAMNT_0023581143 /DNA_START=45 /DNA_END=512 /DNA_ORIENTATION=+